MVEVIFEKEYERVLTKLTESKNRHKYWAEKYTDLCYNRHKEKQNEL